MESVMFISNEIDSVNFFQVLIYIALHILKDC